MQANYSAFNSEQIQLASALAHLRLNFFYCPSYATLQVQGMEAIQNQQTADQWIEAQIVDDALSRFVVFRDDFHDPLQASAVQVQKQLHQRLCACASLWVCDLLQF